MMAERNGRMASTTGLGHAIALRYAAAQADLAVPDDQDALEIPERG